MRLLMRSPPTYAATLNFTLFNITCNLQKSATANKRSKLKPSYKIFNIEA